MALLPYHALRAAGTLAALACLPACGGAPAMSSAPPAGAAASAVSPLAGANAEPRPSAARVAAAPAESAPPAGDRELSLAEARSFMVALINRDRVAAGLTPVLETRAAALAAADRHAIDMARVGFVGHWGSDGSVPEQRHTEAGGYAMMMENAFGYEAPHELVQDARFSRVGLERAQAVFMAEVPPHDGHRKNILGRDHTHVAVGLAMPRAGEGDLLRGPCLTQEFVDELVVWEAPPPPRVQAGAQVAIDAILVAGWTPGAVGISRLPTQIALPARILNGRRSYPIAAPTTLYWPAGFVTAKPVLVDAQRMRLGLPAETFQKPGLYEISLWGKRTGGGWAMVALRTLAVTP